jgi:hypothetical protein
MRYAASTDGDREMPAEQCTKILPVPFFELSAASIMAHVSAHAAVIKTEAESLSGIR